ncbi:MAG: hypothetical protein ACRC91_23105 [Aeromonas sp.]
MAQVKNTSNGLRYIGDVKIIPGKTEEVADAELKSPVVQAWIEAGDIEVVKAK